MPLAEGLRMYLGPDADKFRADRLKTPLLKAAYNPSITDREITLGITGFDVEKVPGLDVSKPQPQRGEGIFDCLTSGIQREPPRYLDTVTGIQIGGGGRVSGSPTNTIECGVGNSVAAVKTEKDSPTPSQHDTAVTLALQVAVAVAIAFLLVFIAFDFMGWLLMIGLSLLIGTVIYLAVFFFVGTNFIRRCFLTICTTSAAALVNASINYRVDVGQHFYQWGWVKEPTDFVIKSGTITWQSTVGLISICAFLLLAMVADNHAQMRLASAQKA